MYCMCYQGQGCISLLKKTCFHEIWIWFDFVFFYVASHCSQMKILELDEKLFIFSLQNLQGFLERSSKKEAEHLQHVEGYKNAPTVATGGLYLKRSKAKCFFINAGTTPFLLRSASHHYSAHCWLSLFILFVRSYFPWQPDDFNDPCDSFFGRFLLPVLFHFFSVTAALLLKDLAELTLMGSCGTWLNSTGRGQIKILS